MRAALLVLAISLGAGCSPYKPGSFSFLGRSFGGERRTVGCLDVGVESVSDPEAEGPAIGYTFANRCDGAVAVDLGAVRATARYHDGSETALVPYDPDDEIRPAVLDARFGAREVIEYQLPAGRDPPDAMCLDLSGLDRGAPAKSPIEVCLASSAHLEGGAIR